MTCDKTLKGNLSKFLSGCSYPCVCCDRQGRRNSCKPGGRHAGERENDGEIFPLTFQKGGNGGGVPFHSTIIGNFMVINVGLKQIYCNYSRTQKIQNGFL